MSARHRRTLGRSDISPRNSEAASESSSGQEATFAETAAVGAKRSNRRDVDVSSVPNLKAISFVRELAFQKPASMFRSLD